MYVDLEVLRENREEAETDGILEWQCCMSFILPLSIPFVASILHIYVHLPLHATMSPLKSRAT